ncbi:MAG: hypothetical protein M0Q43_11250 [Methanothrix sp.]|nr:hypothetical protein [Methanothrix sp.]
MSPATIAWSLWWRECSPCINSSGGKAPHEKTALERHIEATDGQIDGGPAVRSDGGGDRDCGRDISLMG